MRLRSGFNVVVALLLSLGVTYARDGLAQQSEGSMQDARALAKAMRLEQSLKQAFATASQSKSGDGRVSPEGFACLERGDYSFTDELYAAAFNTMFTAQELKDALAFYSKPVGQWHLDYSTALELQARGIKASVPDAEINQDMYSELQIFLDSAAGKKVLERKYETPELKQALRAKLTPIALACVQEEHAGSSSGRR